mgnify:CR=1 FL=1
MMGDTTLRVLGAVERFWAEYHYSPSTRDIQGVPGCASTSSVTYHLRKLREMGFISFDDGIARSIVVLEKRRDGDVR